MSDLAKTLLETPLGQALTATEAATIASAAKTRSVGKGEALFRLNDAGDSLYIVLAGALDVALGEGADTVVATVGPGQIVGELEVMTKARRVANLVARESSEVLQLSAAQLTSMLEANDPAATKLVVTIAKTLARRLAAVNQRIVTRSAAPSPTPAAPAPVAVEQLGDEDFEVLDQLWS